MIGERVGITKWREGDRVVHSNDYGDKVIATVQPGPCTAGAQFVHITWPGGSMVAFQDSIRLASDTELAVLEEER